jgi:hypothetical protein
MKLTEMMGVASAAGMGAAPPGSDPSSPEAKRYAEPGVPKNRKKKRNVVKTDSPLTRKGLQPFGEWLELQRITKENVDRSSD